jgi:hypothetical protein
MYRRLILINTYTYATSKHKELVSQADKNNGAVGERRD